MPFWDEDKVDFGPVPEPLVQPPPVMPTSMFARGLQATSIGSIFSREDLGIDNHLEYGYDVTREPMFERYPWALAGIRNSRLAAARINQILREEENNAAYEAAGFVGKLAYIVGQSTDPLTWFPAIRAVRGAEGVYSLARSGLYGAGAVGSGALVTEAVLQSNMQTRTAEESIINIGAGVVLGGLLGTAGANVLKKGERAAALAAIRRIVPEAEEVIDPITGRISRSVGADEPITTLPREAYEPAGVAARFVDRITRFLQPSSQGAASSIPFSRQVDAMMVRDAVMKNAHFEGLATAPGGALEDRFIFQLHATINEAIGALRSAFAESKGMTREKFYEAVGTALSNEDKGINAHVTKAAQAMRVQLEKIATEAEARGLMTRPKELPGGQKSYFPRMYSALKIAAQEDKFKAAIRPSVTQMMIQAEREAMERTANKIKQLEEDAADLRLPLESRADTIASLEEARKQLRAEAGAELTEAFENLRALLAERRFAAKYGGRTETKIDRFGNRQILDDVADINKKIVAHREKFGEKLAEFNKKMARLDERERTIEGITGKELRANEIRNKLADIEESVSNQMNRLIKQAMKIEREFDRLSPEKQDAAIESLSSLLDSVVASSEKAHLKTLQLTDSIDKKLAKAYEDIAKAGGPAPPQRPNLAKFYSPEGAAFFGQKTPEVRMTGDGGASFNPQNLINLKNIAQKLEDELMPIRKKLEIIGEEQEKRYLRQEALQKKLEDAEAFDAEEAIDTVRVILGDLKDEVSQFTINKGMKAQRLEENLQALDPKHNEFLAMEKLKRAEQVQREFDDIWRGPVTLNDRIEELVSHFFNKTSTSDYYKDRSLIPYFNNEIEIGPLQGRRLTVNDEVIKEFVIKDAEEVFRHYARQMWGEMELSGVASRLGDPFGDPNLVWVMNRLKEESDAIAQRIIDVPGVRAGVRDEAAVIKDIRNVIGKKVKGKTVDEVRENALLTLRKDEMADKNRFEFYRDHFRGNYKMEDKMSITGRMATGARMMAYIMKGGAFGVANMQDVFKPAMTHGLMKYFNEGVGPLLRDLKGLGGAARESKAAGLGTNRVSLHKLNALTDFTDPHAQGTAIERLLQNGVVLANKWNLINWVQDFGEMAASNLMQTKILNAALRGTDQPMMMQLGLTKELQERIAAHAKQWAKVEDGVMVANTDNWIDIRTGELDKEAVNAYRTALHSSVSSQMTVPGIGDRPQWAHSNAGALVFLFRNFALAANRAILIRGLQEEPAAIVRLMVGMATLGMMTKTFQAYYGGQDAWEKFLDRLDKDGPQWLVAEGLDQSGLFTLPFEGSRIAEGVAVGATGHMWNPLKQALMGFPGDTPTRRPGDPAIEAAGPVFSLGDDYIQGVRALIKWSEGKTLTKSEGRAMARTLPYNTFFGMKDLTQILNDDHWMVR